MSEPIRVLLADDHAVVRRGIRALLEQHLDILVVQEVSSADEVLPGVAACDPDVVLLDIRLSGSGSSTGIGIARRLKRMDSRPRVAIITAFDDRKYVFDAFQAGVDAYILKTASEDDLVDAVRAIHGGLRIVWRQFSGTCLTSSRTSPAGAPNTRQVCPTRSFRC